MSLRSVVLFFSVVGLIVLDCIGLLVFGVIYQIRSGSSPGVARGKPGTPLPAHTSKHTAKEFRQALVAYNTRTSLDAYHQFGVRSPKWDAAAERVLKNYVLTVTQAPDAPADKELTRQAKAVLDTGCTDPLILYIYGRGLSILGRTMEAIPVLQRATNGFAGSKYPKSRTYAAPARLAMCYRDMPFTGQANEPQATVAQTIQWAAASLHDGSFLPGEERIQVYVFLHQSDFFGPYGDQWIKALKATPGVDPYVAKVLEGRQLINAAWQARGNGWGNTVTKEGWQGFSGNLRQARTVLEAAYKLHPDWPEAPALMITVAMGDSADAPRLWFDRTVAAQFDYLEAYQTLVSPLLPRWGGSHQAMYDFGKECLDTGRFDTDVPAQYYYMLYAIARDRRQFITQYSGNEREYWQRPHVYANLAAMCDGYAAKGSTPLIQDDYRTLHAMLAWEHGDYDAAKKAFDAVKHPGRDIRYLPGKRKSLALIREEVYTRAKPAGPLLAAAEKLHRTKGPAAAKAEYQRILAKKWDPVTAGYIRQRLADTERELQFQSGQWMTLLPAADLQAWNPVIGNWSLRNGELTGIIDNYGLQIFLRGEYGARLEMTGDVEFLNMPPPGAMHFAGLLAGASDNSYRWQDLMQGPAELGDSSGKCLDYFVDPSQNQARIRSTYLAGSPQFSTCPVPVRRRNTLRLLLWDHEVTTYLNGTLVHKAVNLSLQSPTAGSTVGLGAQLALEPGLTVRFSNLRLRRLTVRPAPPGAGLTTQLDNTPNPIPGVPGHP